MGIWGDVTLALRHQLAMSDLYIRLVRHTPLDSGELLGDTRAEVDISASLALPDIADASGVRVSCTIHAHDAELGGKSGAPLVEFTSFLDKLVSARSSNDVAELGRRRMSFPLTIPRARLWGPSTPVLYHATVTLHSPDGAVLDRVTDRFGLRTLVIDGPFFVLNGARHFMHGMGDGKDLTLYSI